MNQIPLFVQFIGLCTGGGAAAVFINRWIYIRPNPPSGYPTLKVFAAAVLLFLTSLITSGPLTVISPDSATVLPLLFIQEFASWGTIGCFSLVWLYARRQDEVITILLNWGKIPFIWK